MTNRSKNVWTTLRRAAVATSVLAGFAAIPACLDRPIEPVEPRTTSTIVDKLTQSSVNKIDLLLMIDNSGSMADKQQILEIAVPDLVKALVNPVCLDEAGNATGAQPKGPLEDCPVEGSKREFEPILDIHVGVMTSSLGGHGADSCIGDKTVSENDRGKLIKRTSTDGTTPDAITWADKGFLVWDPNPMKPSHTPQGETNIDKLTSDLAAIVGGTGEVGCGFESQLEAWYRFAVDPDPYKSIKVEKNQALLLDTDLELLQQRADFIRPDSLFSIIMLSDENDCSVRDGSQFFFALQRYLPGTNKSYRLPKPRAACSVDPNDPCCRSCGQVAGAGCDASKDACEGTLSPENDAINLRCWDQKHRFGIDFLQPIQRYTDGLTRQTVQDRYGNLVANPLFSDLNPNDDNSNIRDPSLVFVAGIVGVPWQDIARKNEAGQPDLINGLDADGNKVGGFQSGTELAINKTWDVILGDPSCDYAKPECRPTDPLMTESVDPRSGTNPVLNAPLAPPDAAEGANPINGHEWNIQARNDLQYACIFDLPKPVDCAAPGNANKSCDCKVAGNPDKNPLCSASAPTTQVRAKAYPGRRELQLLRSVGDNGIVGSICPVQLSNPAAKDYGYNPAVGAIIERLKKELGGQCLPRSLTPNNEGQVQCLIVEARSTADANQCKAACSQEARLGPLADNDPAVKAAKSDPLNKIAKWNCFCQIAQTQGEDLEACQDAAPNKEPILNDKGEQVDGWCYIDATTVPPTGNVDVVSSCPASERRIIRFVGKGNAAPGATLFITCSGE
ncbi:MAG: hypothetical protein FJ096_18875 [Deltaproteobacteria bacterium]|nr:hypothetical protein [Deltaproteobacteria bacterium]